MIRVYRVHSLDAISCNACAALHDELCVTPKPGLVTPSAPGAHSDMDATTFMNSANALAPYFAMFARAGFQWEAAPLSALLETVRPTGLEAEQAMYKATNGVNTHKGLIFSMGLLCVAAGCLLRAAPHTMPRTPALLGLCKDLLAEDTARHFAAMGTVEHPVTAGERLFVQHGITGARGQAAQGFPLVLHVALPQLQASLAAGLSFNDACVDALLALMMVADDTNILHRGGQQALQFMHDSARKALSLGSMSSPQGRSAVHELDATFCQRNLSPGGCADLLAVTLFLYKIDEASGGMIPPDAPQLKRSHGE